MRPIRFAGAGLAAMLLVAGGSAAQEPSDSTVTSPAPADSAAADSTLVVELSPDTTAVDSSAVPLWYPDPARDDLRTFRLSRSVDVDVVAFGDPHDPVSPPGLQTLADALRLEPSMRTRELSQGPTAETFAIDGAGSSSSDLMLRDRTLHVPGASSPHSHEVAMSEIAGFSVVRGGAAALFGPDATSGAVLARARHPLTEELFSRAVAEEGVDDYQRAAFHIGRRVGANGSFFLSTESRQVEGFFPGTKEVDRQFAGAWLGRLPNGWEFSGGYRRWEGDGRHDDDRLLSVLTKRGDYFAEVYRPHGDGRGLLVETTLSRQRLETNVGGADVRTREIQTPGVRATLDLPRVAAWDPVLRLDAVRWRIEEVETAGVDRFWRGGAALRMSRGDGARGASVTARLDREEGRATGRQLRAEAALPVGPLTGFVVASQNESVPARDAARPGTNERHRQATVGARLSTGGLRMRGAAFATSIDDYRREPTFEEVRAKTAVLDAPIGDARILGAGLGLETSAFDVPGLRFLGELALKSSATWLDTDLDRTAPADSVSSDRLPRRARLTWTGEGTLERRFFRDELLARLRGRLTHLQDRLDDLGEPVPDAWLTDVLLEGEIGDAVFFYRFHDLLERADRVEPGIRFPGFSRSYGISWRFWG